MQVRVDGVVLATIEVRATQPQDYLVSAPSLSSGSKVDIVYVNDGAIGGQDRNLFVSYVSDGFSFVLPDSQGVILDNGTGDSAFDGVNAGPGQSALWGNGALRLRWPASSAYASAVSDMQASRFLQQATFGPTRDDINRLKSAGFDGWLAEQMAMPAVPDYLNDVQGKYDLGVNFLPPNGPNYNPDWIGHRFWYGVMNGRDQLRQRVGFALHSIFVTSQLDSNLYHQGPRIRHVFGFSTSNGVRQLPRAH